MDNINRDGYIDIRWIQINRQIDIKRDGYIDVEMDRKIDRIQIDG